VNAAELCRALLAGPLPAADAPELADEATRQEVGRRLGEVGCELAYAAGEERWLVRPGGPLPPLPGHRPLLALDTGALAVLAACWLHLRFLPARQAAPGEPPDPPGGLDPDDLAELLGARLDGDGLAGALERLCRLGYLRREDGRLLAGPLLDSLDEPAAADQASALLGRHQRLAGLRRRAAELAGPGGGDAAD
jgi:hypothetical protein